LVVPNPIELVFPFAKFFKMFKALGPNFFLSFDSFSNVQGFPVKFFVHFAVFSKVLGFQPIQVINLNPTTKYLNKVDRKGEGHARVFKTYSFTLGCSDPLHSKHIQFNSGLKSSPPPF
jgi:hypothetical protein